MLLSRHSEGLYQGASPQATHQGTLSQSQLAEPLRTDAGTRSGLCVCEQSPLKKNKKAA